MKNEPQPFPTPRCLELLGARSGRDGTERTGTGSGCGYLDWLVSMLPQSSACYRDRPGSEGLEGLEDPLQTQTRSVYSHARIEKRKCFPTRPGVQEQQSERAAHAGSTAGGPFQSGLIFQDCQPRLCEESLIPLDEWV